MHVTFSVFEMFKMRYKNGVLGLGGILLVLTACGNPYRLHYVDVLAQLPAAPSFLPASPTPRMVVTKNPREDVLRQIENGYLPIGYVKFNSVKADEKLALAQAKEVGADLVLTSAQFTNTVNETVAQSVYVAPETVRVDSTYSGRAGSTHSSQQSVTYEGHYNTEFVNQETEFYDQKALFFRRVTPPIFGAIVSPIPEDLRKTLERNRGVMVRAVVKGSPAFRADILMEDILIGLDGVDVIEPGEFYQKMRSMAGRNVTFTVIRNGRVLELPAQLGSAQ